MIKLCGGIRVAAAGLMLLVLGGCAEEQQEPPGERIAMAGNDQGATACVECHGTDGGGQAGPPFPRLAGLPKDYLITQIAAYVDGTRQDATMASIAEALTDEERKQVAEYYAELPPAGGPYEVPQELVEQGETIALEGLEDRELQPCAACHGDRGQVSRDTLPPLSGHPPEYLMRQLQAYAEGERRTDIGGVMQRIAGKLSREEMAATAAYFATHAAEEY